MRKQNYFCYNRNDEIIGKNALSGLVTQSLVSELKKKKTELRVGAKEKSVILRIFSQLKSCALYTEIGEE